MSFEQGSVFAILAIAMGLFIWGRWRYDLVAVLALLVAVSIGIVPATEAFHGFGHPAVITVAAVLVISHALQVSGVVDLLVKLLAPTRRTTTLQIGASCGLALFFSAFMNNVGALALMLPVALRNATKARRSPSRVLMPLSFASLLGGLITLIGTPPNIVIATFRAETEGESFGMFDFAPVGLTVAIVGVIFITAVGWRLLPRRSLGEGRDPDRFHIEAYITEAQVPAGSSLIDSTIRTMERLCENEISVMAIIRGERRLLAPPDIERLREGDILLLEGDPSALEPLLDGAKLKQFGETEINPERLRSPDITLAEVVLMPHSPIEGQSMRALGMHERYGLNLLAVARHGRPPMTRLGNIRFKVGDVLLLQGEHEKMLSVMRSLGCLPLAERNLQLGRRTRIFAPLAIFGIAIAAAATQVVPIQIAFVAAVAALVITQCVALRDIYKSIEWPVIVLLGALIPIGEALQATGGTEVIADVIINAARGMPVWGMLTLLMAVSMLLSDLIHNTPTAVLMAPIAAGIAHGLGLPVDAFLMTVAVGAASPYLTPIGHQSNTLVMGPGGYEFGDYWRMGLPLDILILAVAVPMIMWVWMP